MLEATAKEAAAKREAETARREAAEAIERANRIEQELIQARAPKPKPQETTTSAIAEKFPTYQEYLAQHPDTPPEDYIDARIEWKEQQRARQHEAAQRQTAEQQRITGFQTRYQKDYDKLSDEDRGNIDYFLGQLDPASRAIAAGKQPTGLNAIADYLLDADAPAGLLSHFKDHPEDFQRLSTLHPVKVFGEMGKLESRLDAASTTGSARPPVYSKATPPPKPVSGSPVVSDDDVDEAELPVEEFIRRGNKRENRPVPTHR